MLIDTQAPVTADGTLSARERVRIGAVPAWVIPCTFDLHFNAKQTEHLTYLCVNQQVHAENHQTFVHMATRLETMQAVQRESKWRLQFEPRTQSVNLHSIRIRRGELSYEHANLGEIRVLQREEGLEGYVIDGWFTLLLVLEDVRPGDVLEWSYTIESQPRLLPECCTAFFSLPEGIPVGKYGFAVRFAASRPMKWKSSSELLVPAETREDGHVLWVWSGENQVEAKPEANTPLWHISYPWVQVSDCPDWRTVAGAIAETWKEDSDDETLAKVAAELAGKGSDILAQVEGALELVQDQCRYLNVSLELGGHVPTAAGLVARRRFGDCKDLSFLLVQLLRRLGLAARPVLVNSTLRRSVSGMLPMPGLFNHVVVEYTVQGATRWVDATLRYQGGGPMNRCIPNYGVGLPLDPSSSDLVEPPRQSGQAGTCELKESLLLDTAGAPSLLGVVLTAKGFQAEMLRHDLEQRGAEGLAKERLRVCTSRFFHASRVAECEIRDDREANEFVLAEVFEVEGFLGPSQSPGFCSVTLRENLVLTTLPMLEHLPDGPPRRTPLALPYPCNIVHTIEVHNPALRPFSNPRSAVESPFLKFSRNHRSLMGYWSVTLTLTTLTDAVPADRVDEYQRTLEEVWQESMWSLHTEIGYPPPRRRSDFGSLPAVPQTAQWTRAHFAPPAARAANGAEPVASAGPGTTTGQARLQATATEAAQSAPAATPIMARTSPSRKRAHHRHRPRKGGGVLWPIIISAIILGLIALFIFVIRHDRRRALFQEPRLRGWIVAKEGQQEFGNLLSA
jgi:hypothetical protein